MEGEAGGDVLVRRITGADGPLLRDLRLRSLADSPEAFGQPLADAQASPKELWLAQARGGAGGPRRAWFIAEQHQAGGEAGGLGLVLARRRPPDSCLLFSLWVDPSVRGSGVGARLVAAVEEWALGWGARDVVLWVTRSNRRALPFYERLGYEQLTDGRDAERGREYDAIALRRELARPGT